MPKSEVTVESPAIDANREKQPNRLTEYLQAPRKKRKSFVLLALGPRTRADVMVPAEQLVKASFKNTTVATVRTPEEMERYFNRQVVMVVYDDEFMDLDTGLAAIHALKQKRAATGVKVLFLTRQAPRLIEAYTKTLQPWHEGDDYVDLTRAEVPHVLSRLRTGLAAGYRRRSRRYHVDIPVHYELLADSQVHPGRIVDLSVHGGLVQAGDDRVFKLGDQLKLHIPVGRPLPEYTSDYLRVSARVRRVFIDGLHAGISFEHLSDEMNVHLLQFLTRMVNEQTVRRMTMIKAKAGRG